MSIPEFALHGVYEVDPGAVEFGDGDHQQQVDAAGCANLYFNVPQRDDPTVDTSMSVDFGELWWVEPQLNAHRDLVSLTLIGLSFHVGCGAIEGILDRVGTGLEASRAHWRTTITPTSITAPPVHFSGEEPLPTRRMSDSGRDVVEIHRREDGAVVAIDLWLENGHASDSA